jgi:hypothetical protein
MAVEDDALSEEDARRALALDGEERLHVGVDRVALETVTLLGAVFGWWASRCSLEAVEEP